MSPKLTVCPLRAQVEPLFVVEVDVAGQGLTALGCVMAAMNAATGLCPGL